MNPRYYTWSQYVAYRALRLLGRLLLFGGLTLAIVVLILTLAGCDIRHPATGPQPGCGLPDIGDPPCHPSHK